jgi:hypothetical protein
MIGKDALNGQCRYYLDYRERPVRNLLRKGVVHEIIILLRRNKVVYDRAWNPRRDMLALGVVGGWSRAAAKGRPRERWSHLRCHAPDFYW